MEIKTTEEIFSDRKDEWSFNDSLCQEYYKKQWVSVESLKELLKQVLTNGYGYDYDGSCYVEYKKILNELNKD